MTYTHHRCRKKTSVRIKASSCNFRLPFYTFEMSRPLLTTRTHGLEKATIDDIPSAAAGALAPGIDWDTLVLGVGDPVVKTSAVRGTVVVGSVVPLILATKIPADDFSVVDFIHGDKLVIKALVKFFELAGVQAHGFEVDTLNGHDVAVLFVVGVAAVVGRMVLDTSEERLVEGFQVMEGGSQHERLERV